MDKVETQVKLFQTPDITLSSVISEFIKIFDEITERETVNKKGENF